MYESKLDYRRFGTLSYAPLDDDYLEYEPRAKFDVYQRDADFEEAFPVEPQGDPLRLARKKGSFERQLIGA